MWKRISTCSVFDVKYCVTIEYNIIYNAIKEFKLLKYTDVVCTINLYDLPSKHLFQKTKLNNSLGFLLQPIQGLQGL